MLVDRCPDLEDLHIQAKDSSSPGNMYPLIERGRWPSLKRLSLAIEVGVEERDIMDVFLKNHTTLERLYFCDAHFEPAGPAFPLNNLPNLRSLHMDLGAQFTICSELANRLDHLGLKFFIPSHDPSSLVPRMPILRSFVYDTTISPDGSTRFRDMLMGFPTLERLAINADLLNAVSTYILMLYQAEIQMLRYLYVL